MLDPNNEEAMYLLDNDIKEYVEEVKNRIPLFDTLSTNRQNVLVNMAFNLGIYGLLRFKKMLLAVEKQDWDEAANQMLDSRWIKQVGNRSKELADIMRQ